jgi:hypothetical protein
MARYYFYTKDSEQCFDLDTIKDMMRSDGLMEETVFEADIEYGQSFFYCTHFGFAGDTGEGCGLDCDQYRPRNGKSGRCKDHKNCYSHGKPKIIKLNL